MSYKRSRFLLVIFFCASTAFSQSNIDLEFASLLYSSHVRTSLLEFSNTEEPSNSVSSLENEDEIAHHLEKITLEMIQNEISFESNVPLRDKFTVLRAHLREVGYWNAFAKLLKKVHGNNVNKYKENYKFHGLGFASYYLAFKIAGAIVGGVFFLKGHLDIITGLNSFSWNTILASLLDYPKRYFNYDRLRNIAGGKAHIQELVDQIEKHRASTQLTVDNSSKKSSNIFSQEELQNSRIYGNNFKSFRDWIALFSKNPIQILKKIRRSIKKRIKNKQLQDIALMSLLKNKNIAPSFQFWALWLHLKTHHPEVATEILEELKISPKGLGESLHLKIRRDLYDWTLQLVDCDTEDKLLQLYRNAPSSLSYLQRNDIWVNVFLPYLIRKKGMHFPAFNFRPFYVLSEGHLADAIAFGPITQEAAQRRWLDTEKELFPLRMNLLPIFIKFKTCKQFLGF